MKPPIGQCHLCGLTKQLSFEHFPPGSSNNKDGIKVYSGIDLISSDKVPWDTSGLKYKHSQKGSGDYTLCRDCNTNTGNWYVKDYSDFSNRTLAFIQNLDQPLTGKSLILKYKSIYPLRIIKQILVMFASINGPRFMEAQPGLKAFLMDRSSNTLDLKKYRLSMFITNGQMMRRAGLTAKLDSETGATRLFTEFVYSPFGFVLDIDPTSEDESLLDISAIAINYAYEEEADIELILPIYEANSPFPLDFRSKHEIETAFTEGGADEQLNDTTNEPREERHNENAT